jgi:3-oxoacyl-[acyl-carrier protein] reductase
MNESHPLASRVALVTGASGGIGAALSRRLAAAGARVALHYGAHPEPVDELAASLRAAGAVVAVVGADLADRAALGRMMDEVESELGAVDVLVSNAGVSRQRLVLEEVSEADWDESLAVNLTPSFLLAQRVLPGMRSRRFGRILFVSSVAAFTGGVVGPHYAAAKAGLLGLTHALAARVAADGVTVNAIAPALITETRMLPGEPDELRTRIPVGRLGRPDEVADVAMAMLANGYVTSQVYGVDGGMHPR